MVAERREAKPWGMWITHSRIAVPRVFAAAVGIARVHRSSSRTCAKNVIDWYQGQLF